MKLLLSVITLIILTCTDTFARALSVSDSLLECYTSVYKTDNNRKNYHIRLLLNLKILEKEISEGDTSSLYRGLVFCNLGDVKRRMGDSGQVYNEYFLKGISCYKTIYGDSGVYFLIDTFNVLGNIALKANKYHLAFKNFFIGLVLADSDSICNKYDHLMNLQVGMIHRERGDFEKALDYYLKAMRMDADFQNINALSLEKIDDYYSSKSNEEALLADVKSKVILLLISVLILLLVVFLYLRQRSVSKYRQLQNEQLKELNKIAQEQLQYKIQEIVEYSILATQKKSLLQEIAPLIKSSHANDKNKAEKLIHQSINEEDDWLVFKRMFDQISPGFYKKLSHDCAELSKTELRLCGLIKLDLGTKEIASILNITPESVNKARYRIRKKLNLQKEESLDEYLMEIS